ncbi:hypothetical protein LTR33_010442 [Friedmanniomyces endolithicus]|nr:hypothetical protein LTR33_010442 [Friedmanniomyces endolithicus]
MAAPAVSCPAPFLAESAYPYTAGLRSGRFCGPFAPGVSCCLPCPLEGLVTSDAFQRNLKIAYWFNVPALLCQVFLLASFAVLKEKHSHAHYLSVGLCISLALLELSFIIPLGVEPDVCHDAITPNDIHSDMTCAWSGALLEAGAMAGAVWILLRSLWTHLRVCADLHHSTPLFWTAQTLGWGLPALFLAISLPITGVSYQVGTTCFPNQRSAFITWFGWLLAFACLAALLQLITTGFCLWLYLRHFLHLGNNSSADSADSSSRPETALVPLNTSSPSQNPSIPPASHRATATTTPYLSKRLAYHRVRSLLLLQWRSIALSLFVITSTFYFGVVFAATTRAAHADSTPSKTAAIEIQAACLVLNNGRKGECLQYARGFVLGEGVVLATFYMSALIGVVTFGLMVRRDMVVGWWELIGGAGAHWARRRGRGRELRDDGGGSGGGGKMVQMTDEVGMAEVPEAGDVGIRHETTDLFDGEDGDEADVDAHRPERTRVRGGEASGDPPSGGGDGGIEAGDVGTRHETTDFFDDHNGVGDEIDEEAQRPKRTRRVREDLDDI